MSEAVRRGLIKKILQKGIEAAQKDSELKKYLSENKGESMLFIITDLKAPYGIEIKNEEINFTDTPDIKKTYTLVASCNENTIIHLIKGMDPGDAFMYGLIDVEGRGWFKRVMILRRIFRLGEQRGLKTQVVHA